MLRFTLDNTVIEDPEGWDSLKTEINYDKQGRIITCKTQGNLTFTGDAYKKFSEDFATSACMVYNLTVEEDCDECNGNWFPIIKGTIFLTDMKFRPCFCEAKVNITDNNLSSQILNNELIKYYPNATQTKTGGVGSLTASTAVDLSVDFYQISGGVATNKVIRGWNLIEVLENLILFITDSDMTFRSDYLSGLPYEILVTSGLLIREGIASETPGFDLNKLKDVLSKVFNLVLYAEGKVLRLEGVDYINNLQGNIEVSVPENMQVFTDTTQLYSGVKLGNKNEVNRNNAANANLVRGECVQHREELYTIITKCNNKATLDLTHDVITSHNTINAIAYGDDSFDDNCVLIEYTLPNVPVLDNPFNTAGIDLILNKDFYNCEIITRYDFLGDLYKTSQTAVDYNFKACHNSPLFSNRFDGLSALSLTPAVYYMEFPDDYNCGFDGVNAYGNGTPQGTAIAPNTWQQGGDNRFTAQADGVYTLRYDGNFAILRFPDSYTTVEVNGTTYVSNRIIFPSTNGYNPKLGITLRHYDSFNNLISLYGNPGGQSPVPCTPGSIGGYLPSSFYAPLALDPGTGCWIYHVQNPVWEITLSRLAAIPMTAGDYVQVALEYDYNPVPYSTEAARSVNITTSVQSQTFRTLSVNTGSEGGIIQTGNPNDVKLTKYKFESCLDNKKINSILTNKNNSLLMTDTCFPDHVRGCIDKLTIDHKTKVCDFELRSNYKRI